MKRKLFAGIFLSALIVIFVWMGMVLNIAAAAKWDGDITIGFSGPLSGGAAKYGENCLTGTKLAVEDVNAAGGVNVSGKKYELKLVHYDDMYKPANTVANARRLVSSVKPIAIFCPHSGGILALEKINEKEGFIINGYTTNNDVINQKNRLVFMPPTRADLSYGLEMVKKAFAFGSKIAHLTGSHEAGVAWMKLSEATWKKLGGQIVSTDSVNYMGVTDFYPYLTKILQSKPDVINLYGPSEPAAMIVNQARELGYKGGFLLGDQIKLDEMERVASLQNLNNSIGVCPYPLWPLAESVAFSKRLMQLYGKDYVPTREAAAHYEAVWMIVKCIEKAQTKDDPYAIFSKINNVLPLEKNNPNMRDGIGPSGELLGGTYVIAVRNGKYTKPIPLIWGKELYPAGKTSVWRE
jgi:branched-chain amino acid transport system substrate-binding protein